MSGHVDDAPGLHAAAFRLIAPTASAPATSLDIAVLRILGRLEFALTSQLQALVFSTTQVRTMYRQLERLTSQGLIWKQAVSLDMRKNTRQAVPNRPATKTPMTPHNLYGLTPEGKAYLATHEIEPDLAVWEALKTRDRRAPAVPQATLLHDLQASWWVTSVLCSVMRNRFCTGVFAQVEFHTTPQQRVDALVGLRLNATIPARDVQIPWASRGEGTPQDRWYWFALEVDRGTEQLSFLLGKAVMYRDLTTNGTYQQLVGTSLLPVFLVPTLKRAAQIGAEFKAAWPTSPAVAAVPQAADHPSAGVLWGAYRTLVAAEPKSIMPLTLGKWQQAMI